MKPVVIISTGVLFLLGIAAPTYAQRDQQQDHQAPEHARPERQHDTGEQPQGRNQEQQQRVERQDRNREQQQRAQQQDRNREQQHRQGSWGGQRRERVQPGREREVWERHRARNWQSEHRDWRQRGGYSGYRVPNDRYRRYFGRNHWFRIHRYPMELYGGYPRFRYGGYWVSLLDPWPEYWGPDWYENDDVYISYSDGGYYLYDRRYPGDRIAISFSLQ